MHALPVNLPCVKQLPVITNEAGASPHAGSTCAIGVVTVRPFNRQPAQLYFKLTPDPNNTFFFISTCTTQYPWVLANPDLSQAMASSKQKRTHTVFRASSTHRSASTSKPRFVGERMRLGDVVSASSERNKGGRCSAVYSVTNSQGFVPSEDYFSKEVYSKDLKTYRVVKRNMIAYNPSRINVGSVALQDKCDEVVVSPLYVVFSVDESWVKPGYAVRFLKSKPGLDQIAFRSIGTVRNNLKFKALCQMRLKLPSLAVQEERLANLASIESQINQSRKAIEEFDQLVKSRFVEMFGDPVLNPKGWSTHNLKALGELKNGVNFKSVDNGFEIKCLGVGDFKDRYAIKDMSLVSDVSLNDEPNANQLLQDGDVVFVRSNGNKALVGRCLAIFPGEEKVTFSGFCIRFRNASKKLELDYLLNCLKTDSIRRAMTGRGANIQNLSQSLLSKIEIPLPPIALQREFAAFVSQVDKSRFVRDHEMNFR